MGARKSKKARRFNRRQAKDNAALAAREAKAFRDAAELVDELMAGIDLLLKYYRFPKRLYEELHSRLRRFFAHDGLIDLITRAKWLCAMPMARLFGEIVPTIKNPFSFGGKLHAWFRAKLRRTPANAKLWFSWFQLKRCTPVVPEEFIGEQARKHRAAMAEPPAYEPDVSALSKSVCRVLELAGIRWNGEVESKTPSRSSCHENTRKSGGAHKYLEQIIGEQSLAGEVRDYVTLDHVGLYSGNTYEPDTPVFRREARVCPGVYFKLLSDQADFDVDGAIPAAVEFVLEPLKVRTITKGPAALYAFCSQWQMHVHGRMKSLEQFRLIGRPVHEEDLLWARGSRERQGWEFVSIDYSAATDKLDWRLSQEMLLLTIGRDLDYSTYEKLSRALGSHEVSYPPKMKIEPVTQANGQLMGSVMSFPILCLANAATICLADQLYNQQVRARSLEVVRNPSEEPVDLASLDLDYVDDDMKARFLVNGDDGLVYRPRAWREIHERVAKEAGLTYSVGKVYSSKNYANINSTGFWVEGERCDRLDYIPIGLMRGHHKVSCGVKGVEKDADGILASLDAMESTFLRVEPGGVLGALDRTLRACTERPQFATAKFISLNKRDLGKVLGPRNLWIAIPHGGAGFTPPPGFRFKITDYQRAIAGACPLPVSSRPLPGREVSKSGAVKKGEHWYIEKDIWASPASARRDIKKGLPITPVIGEGWTYEPKDMSVWNETRREHKESLSWVELEFPSLFSTRKSSSLAEPACCPVSEPAKCTPPATQWQIDAEPRARRYQHVNFACDERNTV